MTRPYRIVVAGGRKFNDYKLLKGHLDKVLSSIDWKDKALAIVSGGARGADALGERYANERGIKVMLYPANWDKHGKSAGYKRNKLMAENSEVTVAFWDGKSKGTKHMIDLTKRVGNHAIVVKY